MSTIQDQETAGDLPQLAVGAIVVVEQHLLLVRRIRPPGVGLWSIPGGRVEAGETVEAAVEREVAEETGLHVDCGDLVGWVQRSGEGFNYVILDFYASPAVGYGKNATSADLVVRPADDAGDARWVAFADLASVVLVPKLMSFLEEHNVL